MRRLPMPHRRFEFDMPATAGLVFDSFHHHRWRQRWDSLVRETRVVGGAPCPYVGAVTSNAGRGLLRALGMRTRFVSYQRPLVAAAVMEGRSFPFSRWAASMRHRDLPGGTSVLIYTYSFEVAGGPLRVLLEPCVQWVFDRKTRQRFARLRRFLAEHADEVRDWQQAASPA